MAVLRIPRPRLWQSFSSSVHSIRVSRGTLHKVDSPRQSRNNTSSSVVRTTPHTYIRGPEHTEYTESNGDSGKLIAGPGFRSRDFRTRCEMKPGRRTGRGTFRHATVPVCTVILRILSPLAWFCPASPGSCGAPLVPPLAGGGMAHGFARISWSCA